MVFVTAGWLVLLGVLGMAPIPSLPVNDKALHFFGVSLCALQIPASDSGFLDGLCHFPALLCHRGARVSWAPGFELDADIAQRTGTQSLVHPASAITGHSCL